MDKNQASTLFRLLAHYRPESCEDKAKRLKAKAESGVKGKADISKTEKPLFVKVREHDDTRHAQTIEARCEFARLTSLAVFACCLSCCVVWS